jgi:putative ABC transport system permease protein
LAGEKNNLTGIVEGIRGIKYELQPLSGIIPGEDLSKQIGTKLGTLPLKILGIIFLMTLMATGINFSNMFVSILYDRNRSIGIRKVYGARNIHILNMLISESILIVILSVMIGFAFLPPVKSWLIASLPNAGDLFTVDFEYGDLLYFFLFALVLGVLLGIFPSVIYSKIHPLRAIRGIKDLRILKILGLRKSLISLQLFLFIFLMIGLTAVVRQRKYVNEIDLGFETENIHYLNIPSTLRQEEVEHFFTRYGNSNNLTFSSMVPHGGGINEGYVHFGNDSIEVQIVYCDEYFFDIYQIDLIRFSDRTTLGKNNIFVNESLWEKIGDHREMGLKYNGNLMHIAGKVGDFHLENIEERIKPAMFISDPDKFTTASIEGIHDSEQWASIRLDWNKKFNEMFPEVTGISQLITDSYRFFNGFIGVISTFILFISGVTFLGLFGLTTYLFKERKREISIRKILGAGFSTIYFEYLKSFALIIAIAVITGYLTGSVIFSNYLNLFAFHVEIGITEFLFSFSTLFLLLILSTLGHLKYLFRLNPAREVRNDN